MRATCSGACLDGYHCPAGSQSTWRSSPSLWFSPCSPYINTTATATAAPATTTTAATTVLLLLLLLLLPLLLLPLLLLQGRISWSARSAATAWQGSRSRALAEPLVTPPRWPPRPAPAPALSASRPAAPPAHRCGSGSFLLCCLSVAAVVCTFLLLRLLPDWPRQRQRALAVSCRPAGRVGEHPARARGRRPPARARPTPRLSLRLLWPRRKGKRKMWTRRKLPRCPSRQSRRQSRRQSPNLRLRSRPTSRPQSVKGKQRID